MYHVSLRNTRENGKFRFSGEFSFLNVGALIERPRGFAKQNRIATRRLLIISFGNPNHCKAMIGRAINDRPYEQNCRLFDKSEFECEIKLYLYRLS